MNRYTIITVPSGTVVEQSDGRIVIKNDYYSEFSRCATVTVVEAETVDPWQCFTQRTKSKFN